MNTFGDAVTTKGEIRGDVKVALSNELVTLLSDQLYQSPTKAIEELVVNSYDADAKECRLYVPAPSALKNRFIVVFDNGIGMSFKGIEDLWHIGSSKKREQGTADRSTRKQIGRFGIGKLATYTVANRLTYITKKEAEILAVSLDFTRFSPDPTGASSAVNLEVRKITNWKEFSTDEYFKNICELALIDITQLDTSPSWTAAILEDLKPKAQKLALGRLKWILETAMPLKSDFKLYLNGTEIHSSKEDADLISQFSLDQIPEKRLQALVTSSGQNWTVKDGGLVCDLFPSGIKGHVILTQKSLLGKSDDLCRSHGFFIKVRGRLVSEDHPSFGIEATSYQTFYRFRADIEADDLDSAITAPREGLEDSPLKTAFKTLLESIFNEARGRYQASLLTSATKTKNLVEHERNYVSSRLVEQPVADILSDRTLIQAGAEADGDWFYLRIDKQEDIAKLVDGLYTEQTPRQKYRYTSENLGKSARMVKFDPFTSTFAINEDHDLARNFADGPARELFEDVVTAEALLEVYLREAKIPPSVIGELLEKRDTLWRSLASDHPYSLAAIGNNLRDAAGDERDLEISVVAAARALGFVATHVSGSGEPDGIARFIDYPEEPKVIVLETKSSASVPSLSAIDFAGLHEHMNRHKADGCLLVAPSYPGSNREADSAAAVRARSLKISCWTVEQLARVVNRAETRHITAKDMLSIILSSFAPDEVTASIENLLGDPTWDNSDLIVAILDSLQSLEKRLKDANRTIDLVAAEVSRNEKFQNVKKTDISECIRHLAAASKGGITVRDEKIFINLSQEEIRRRLSDITGSVGHSLRAGTFRHHPKN